MDIEQIYGEQKPWIERKMSEVYNSFVKDLESDTDYELSDDEVSELFNELFLRHMLENMSDYEATRIFNSVIHKI